MIRILNPPWWRLCGCDGAPAVETALTLMLLATFIIGIVEFSFGYWVLNDMQSAVAAGGRYAIVHRLDSSGNCTDPSSDAVSLVKALLPGGLSISVSGMCVPGTGASTCCSSTATSADTVQITASYTNSFMTVFALSFSTRDTVPLI